MVEESSPDSERQEWNKHLHGLEVLGDGSVIYSFDGGNGLYRINACGELLWKIEGNFHHSISRDESGSVWTWPRCAARAGGAVTAARKTSNAHLGGNDVRYIRYIRANHAEIMNGHLEISPQLHQILQKGVERWHIVAKLSIQESPQWGVGFCVTR